MSAITDYEDIDGGTFRELTRQAIEATRRAGHVVGRRRNYMVFRFVQHLLVHPKAADYPAEALKPYVLQWHTACADIIQDKQCNPIGWSAAWLWFTDLWDNRRVTLFTEDIWHEALRLAKDEPAPPIAGLEAIHEPEILALCAAVYWVGVLSGKNSARVSQARAGLIVVGQDPRSDADPETRGLGAIALRRLVSMGILRLLDPPRPNHTGLYAAVIPGEAPNTPTDQPVTAATAEPISAPATPPPAPAQPASQWDFSGIIDDVERAESGQMSEEEAQALIAQMEADDKAEQAEREHA